MLVLSPYRNQSINLLCKLMDCFYMKTTLAFNGLIPNWEWSYTAQKMKFSVKDFFSKCDQMRSFLRIWSLLLKKSLMENFIFCAVLAILDPPLCALSFLYHWFEIALKYSGILFKKGLLSKILSNFNSNLPLNIRTHHLINLVIYCIQQYNFKDLFHDF